MDHTNHSSAWTKIIQAKIQRKQRNKNQTLVPNWNTIIVEEGEITFKVFAKNCRLSVHSSWNLVVVCLVPNFIACLDLLSPWRRRRANLRQPLLSHLLRGRDQSSLSDLGKKLCVFSQALLWSFVCLCFPLKFSNSKQNTAWKQSFTVKLKWWRNEI